jgi:hypothetical protein
MIAVSSSGTGFRALATYLVHGRTGLEEGRIAWTSARNLPTADPQIAATLMRATAAQNVRVEQPVYHVALAFDPHDAVDRAAMERVADRVLARLGLKRHQVLIVAHQDREHPHLHVLVNRVHPETGKAWDRWQDLPAIQRVLREEERALGLRELAADGAHARGAERGIVRENGVTSQPPKRRDAVVERARSALPAIREAASWDAVTTALYARGLRLQRRGSGLVVTDGEHFVKASRIGPDLMLRHLEQRLGAMLRAEISEAERGTEPRDVPRASLPTSRPSGHTMGVPVPAFAPTIEGAIGPTIARLAHEIAQLERARSHGTAHPHVAEAEAVERARRVQRAAAQERHDRASSALEAALARTFAEPERAHAALLAATQAEGVDAGVARLRERPETYGPLATVERSRGFGLVRGRDDTGARQAAREAAMLVQEFVAAQRTLEAATYRLRAQESLARAVIGSEMHGLSGERDQVADAPDQNTRGRDHRTTDRHASLATELLERGVRDAARKLTPAELQQLHTLLTRPQIALVTRLRETVRDAVLGRERLD